MPVLVLQGVKVRRMRGRSRGRSVIVAMASNRLSLSESSRPARHDLSELASELGAPRSGGRLAEDIAEAEVVLIFDPLPVSVLWRHRGRCRRDNILIVDGVFLLTFFLMTALTTPIRKWAAALRAAKETRVVRRPRSRPSSVEATRAIFYALVAECYADILIGFGATKAVFFTCNSTLTEVLRAFLLQWERCDRIYEVMHGVGSVPAERFFASVLSAGRDSAAESKLVFVPQVPNLPLYGAFRSNVSAADAGAINAYINQYLRDHGGSEANIRHLVESECREKHLAGYESDAPIVIAIFGNYPTNGRLYEASSFRAECVLIELVRDLSHRNGSNCRVIYVPHPTYGPREFRHPVFDANRVIVYRSSVFCWLVADLCISLNSSAMFESAYFGARAFTPMTDSDQIFTEAYLDLVSHPESGTWEACVTELNKFLSECKDRRPRDIARRISDRLELMVHREAPGQKEAVGR